MKFKNNVLKTVLVLGAVIIMTSCSKETPIEPAFPMTQEEYQEILNNSLFSTGNNARLKKFLEKFKNDEEVYIAAIGGSVTEGGGPKLYTDGYFYQFINRLKKEFNRNPKARIIYNDAGLSGTSSAIGVVRYQSDVVEFMNHTPDLLIIEFSVNDYLEPTKLRGFEEMIRRALNDNPDCAVIALYAAATYGNSQDLMKTVSDYYQIQQVSISNAVNGPIEKGLIKKDAYYTDSVHPFTEGHTLMADCLINLLRTVNKEKKDEPFVIPENAKYTPSLSNIVRILGDDEFVKINAGDFSENDPNCQGIKKTNKSNFPVNWSHKSGTKSFVMNINCKNLIFVYKEGAAWIKNIAYGKAEVLVDGIVVKTFDSAKENAWNNCAVDMIIDEAESKDHVVEVRMINGDEEKEFTIVAMAYSR